MNKENKNIFLMIVRGQTTHFGNAIFDYANKVIISNLTSKSSFFMMIYLASESIIQLLLNLFAGYIADNNNRKNILILTDLLAGIATFFLYLFYNPSNIWALVVVNMILALLFSFNRPSYKAIVRDLLSKKGIYRYNSVSKILAEVVSVAAPIISIFLIKQFGFKYGMLINSITFFISAYCEHHFQIIIKKEPPKVKLIDGIWQGIRYIINDKAVLVIILASAVLNFLDAIYLFYLPFTSTFSRRIDMYAYILTAQSLGSILGAVLVAKLKLQLIPKEFIHILLVSALSLLLIGEVHKYMIVVLLLFSLFSLTVTVFNINLMSFLQVFVKEEFIGRVFSTIFLVSGALIPLGSIVAGMLNLKDWLIFQYIGLGQLFVYIICLILFKKKSFMGLKK